MVLPEAIILATCLQKYTAGGTDSYNDVIALWHQRQPMDLCALLRTIQIKQVSKKQRWLARLLRFDSMDAESGMLENRTPMEAVLEAAIGEFFGIDQKEALRVFHGRGHLYPGLEHVCIDWFKPLVLITAYSEIADAEELAAHIVETDTLGQVKSIILQKRYEQGAPAELLFGDDLPCIIVQENKLLFEVHPGRQQNAGLFLDTRPLREWLQSHSKAKNVLNLFAYTCSLSVAALAGGATQVTNVDISKTSIRWGEKNHQLNNQPLDRVKSIPYNLFRSWGRIQQYGRYDLVVIDPPTRQHGSFDVEKNYRGVIRKLSKMCKPDADIIATVNSPFLESRFLLDLFSANLPTAKYVEVIPAAAEFADKYPQRGLKICHFKLT